MKHGLSVALCFLFSAGFIVTNAAVHADVAFPPLLSEKVSAVAKSDVSLFDTADVHLTDGPFKDAMEVDHAYLLRVNPDRLLAWFRKDAGLPQKGEVYGGWEAEGIAGHSLGHYLSACAQMYRCTGDPLLKQRVDYIVDQLAECQQANGSGYTAAIPDGKKVFAQLASGDIRPQGGFTLNGCWVPWYTMHKVMAGLYDSANLCGSTRALDVLTKLCDWCGTEVKDLNDTQMQKMLEVEQGGMAEVLANTYSVTGNASYLALAKRFRHDRIFTPLAEGKDILDGWHGNANIPKFIGYQRIFELTGDAKWGTAAQNFWTFVSRDRSFANGGHGLYEYFFPVQRFEAAMHSTNGPETCNSYNMLKLTTHLFAEDARPAYIDFYERALYNHILTSQNPRTGGFVYYTPMSPGSFRTYSTDYDDFWCCVGTGMENHARYGQLIYAHATDRLLVNLFIPSTVRLEEQHLTLSQETVFPNEPRTQMHLSLKASKKFTLSIRYPSWVADESLRVTVNHQPVQVAQHPGQYVDIDRMWNDGDTVAVELPMKLRTEMLPHSESYVSILYGPILLAGELGRKGLVDSDFRGQLMGESKVEPASQVPAIVQPVKDIAKFIEPISGKPTSFSTHDLLKPGDLTLSPLYAVYDQRYAVYWRLSSEKGWEADEAKWAAAEVHEHDLAARTLDHVRPGEQQPEVDHEMKGEKTNNGTFNNRNWRDSRDGGWFSYKMKVDPQHSNTLLCVYWGSDEGPREFDISAGGTSIASETLHSKKPNEFVEVLYDIPAELTHGKSKIEIKFSAKPGMMAGGVFDCRVLSK